MRHAATYGIAALGVLATAAAAAETTAAPAMLVVLPTDWLERHATLFSMFGGVVAFAVSTWFVVRQMRDTQSWRY